MAYASFECIIAIVLTHVLFALWLGFNSKFMCFLGFFNNLILHAQGLYLWQFKKSIKAKIIGYF